MPFPPGFEEILAKKCQIRRKNAKAGGYGPPRRGGSPMEFCFAGFDAVFVFAWYNVMLYNVGNKRLHGGYQ